MSKSDVKIASPKAELAVLRGLCNKDKVIAGTLLSTVDESYFSSDQAVEVYNRIQSVRREDGELPKYKILLEDPQLSKDSRAFLRDSEATITSVSEAKRVARMLYKYRQRRITANISNLVNLGFRNGEGNPDCDAILDKITENVALARLAKSNNDAFLHFGKNNNSSDFLHDLIYGDASEDVIPTGFKTFDNINAGLMRGSLVTLGANSGAGKSQMASALAVNLASMGYKAMVVPLEMSKREMGGRIVANVAQMDSLKILTSRLSESEKALADKRMRRWLKRVKEKGGRYTIFKPEQDMTIEEIFAATECYHSDVRIIDYISLLKGVDGDDQWKQLGAVARYAKINAEQTKNVNILLCQVSDEGRIKYSQAIKEHSNNAWVWTADQETKEQGILKIQQIKSRNQNPFPFTLGINYAHSYVYDLEGFEDNINQAPQQPTDEELPNLAAE